MSSPAADILRKAAAINSDDDRRRGSTVILAGDLDMVVTGDLHGNRSGLANIIRYAEPAKNPSRRLVLQEIIHGPPEPSSGQDRSIEVLLRAARLKIAHPRQVLFVLGNHDVAQITGNEISRNGQPSCKTFTAGVRFAFPDDAGEILSALEEFILSMPVAIRCPNSVLISHSLPAGGAMGRQCIDVLDRPYRMDDLRRGGPVYEWTWGRGHQPRQVDELAESLGVDFFIIGHLHRPNGYDWVTPRVVTLASDNAMGCLMRFSTDSLLTKEAVEAGIRKISTLNG